VPDLLLNNKLDMT